ncbi:MAG TPA: TetR/AcrR family transcriptional regulator [Caulobacteraceae bacterium]
MARPQAADYAERRAAIVEQAAELYACKGFASASVADLADRLGASKALVYHYYPSKEEILFEVMDSHLRKLSEAVEETVALDAGPEDKLRALAHSFMRLYVGAAARHKVLLNELDALPPTRRAEIVERQRRLIDAVEALILAIQPALADRPQLTRPAAMLFFGMINWTHTWYREGGGARADEIADLAADMALAGLSGLQPS